MNIPHALYFPPFAKCDRRTERASRMTRLNLPGGQYPQAINFDAANAFPSRLRFSAMFICEALLDAE